MWLSIFDNAFLQGLSFGIAVLGITIAFRVLKFPDLTADGSFLLGATVFASMVNRGAWWPIAMMVAGGAGMAAGLCTALLHQKARVNRLLAGILTSMICYSIGFRVLAMRSNLSLGDLATPLTWAEAMDRNSEWSNSDLHPFALLELFLVTAAICGTLFVFLRSEFGVVLRASGENDNLIAELGRRPGFYRTVGLVLSNGLIGLAGALVASRQGFADVNMGVGVIIILVASLVIGEDVCRLAGLDRRHRLLATVLSPVVGCVVYYFLFLLMVRASVRGWIPFHIHPTDLKALSAGLVAVVIIARVRSSRRDAEATSQLPI